MGRKGSWFSSVKKALSPSSKEKKSQKESKSKKKWVEKEEPSTVDSSNPEPVTVSHPHPAPVEEEKLAEAENEQTKHAYNVAVATATAAEAAVVAAHAAAEVVRLTAVPPAFPGKSREEGAAIRIQTAFRGYLARRALRALRGLVRLKSLVDGPSVKRQTANALKCMQALSRVQSQICSRRIRMSEENKALQRQLIQKRATELESLRMGDDWDASLQSKEQVEASLLHKYEAAMRRERALAYSFSHQQSWKKSSRSTNLLYMDPTNPHWGWSWLERWMAARPWEQGVSDKELNGEREHHSSVKNGGISGGEITKSFARHQLNSDTLSSPVAAQKPNHHHAFNHQSPSTPPSAAKPVAVFSSTSSSLTARRLNKSASPKVLFMTNGSGGGVPSQDDDSRSIFSVQSERNRRHSIAGSSIRDDESLASSPSVVPSYMAPTQSAKAKTRLQSPLGMENGTPEKVPAAGTNFAKKRLSYPPSPARPRRQSGPPKLETSSITYHDDHNHDVNGAAAGVGGMNE